MIYGSEKLSRACKLNLVLVLLQIKYSALIYRIIKSISLREESCTMGRKDSTLTMEEIEDEEEMEYSMGKLIRQASLNTSNSENNIIMPQRTNYKISRHGSLIKPQSQKMNQLKTQRSLSSGAEKTNKRSTDEMKAQIKFWARAVASNVRQES
ncbi:hypothetical protein ABFS83_13G070800 [Erythranthe nasuta]